VLLPVGAAGQAIPAGGEAAPSPDLDTQSRTAALWQSEASEIPVEVAVYSNDIEAFLAIENIR
jgi:hypothetical protein